MSDERILLAHGSGGQLMSELIDRVFRARFGPHLSRDDSTLLSAGGAIAFTTDSFVVDPLFFPGGDIGRLAVCGTVNDLATAGAVPIALSASFILAEGLLLRDLERVADSMASAATEAGIEIVTGDTKVVPAGAADRMFITTSGIGRVVRPVSGAGARPGDVVLINGSIGDHGIAVISQREGLSFETTIESDCAPLAGLVQEALNAGGEGVHAMRDPTRGGLVSSLNEIAAQSRVAIELNEVSLPIRPPVASACEMLGFDPLYVANEGKMLFLVAAEAAESILAAMRRSRYGAEAVAIGRVLEGPAGTVTLRTALGTHRFLDPLVGELMPRIC